MAPPGSGTAAPALADGIYVVGAAPTTVLYTGEQAKVAQVAMDVINDSSRLNRSAGDAAAIVATSAALTQADVQAQIVRRVEELVAPTQVELLCGLGNEDGPTVTDIVKKTMALVAEHSIDIPRILVKPKGAMQAGYRPFALDVSKMNFQPQDQGLVGRGLQSGKDVLRTIVDHRRGVVGGLHRPRAHRFRRRVLR